VGKIRLRWSFGRVKSLFGWRLRFASEVWRYLKSGAASSADRIVPGWLTGLGQAGRGHGGGARIGVGKISCYGG
jgi:hypothetical protein